MKQSCRRAQWAIVGGGPHGVHMAARLLRLGVHLNDIAIIDPEDSLLARWTERANTVGMDFLRSPAVHHLDDGPWSLTEFASKRRWRQQKSVTGPYRRPSVEVFAAHSKRLVEALRLPEVHVRDRASRVTQRPDGWKVLCESGATLVTSRLVLALGPPAAPLPIWAQKLPAQCLSHVFELGSRGTSDALPGRRVVVVGAGLSGAQFTLRAQSLGAKVTLVSRSPIRKALFDADPGWMGPKYLRGFNAEPDLAKRRSIIRHARRPGTMTPEVATRLRAALESGDVTWADGEIASAAAKAAGELTCVLVDGRRIDTDLIVLATGFADSRPGGRLVDELIEHADLRTSECGYPVVNQALEWAPGLHVMGALAELEVGPVSRNIAGARLGARRILESAMLNRQAA